jgi:myo-inositol-hexaphosphate 3-phosphohydrolase
MAVYNVNGGCRDAQVTRIVPRMRKLSVIGMHVQCLTIYIDSVLVGAMVEQVQGVISFEFLEDHGEIRTKLKNWGW